MLLTSSLLNSMSGVVHGFTTRHGGVSSPPYDTLNLAWDRGEEAKTRINWDRVSAAVGLPDCPVGVVHQVHGNRVVESSGNGDPLRAQADADAIFCTRPGELVAVRTADCVPILLAGPGGVAAVHAGWRGTAQGIGPSAVRTLCERLECRPSDLTAVIGPCIGLEAYEVGEEVVEGLASLLPEDAFVSRTQPRPHVDLKAANRVLLEQEGVGLIDVLPQCTFSDSSFFSHRREGARTGRMAAVIGMVSPC